MNRLARFQDKSGFKQPRLNICHFGRAKAAEFRRSTGIVLINTMPVAIVEIRRFRAGQNDKYLGVAA